MLTVVLDYAARSGHLRRAAEVHDFLGHNETTGFFHTLRGRLSHRGNFEDMAHAADSGTLSCRSNLYLRRTTKNVDILWHRAKSWKHSI